MALSGLGLPAVGAADSQPRQGRVAYSKARVFNIPSTAGQLLKTYSRDDILEIGETVSGLDQSAYNRIWYKIPGEGYVYSGGVQPVSTNLQQTVEREFPKDGLLGEISVPWTESRWKPTLLSRRGYRLYYETTYWVRAVFDDEKGQPWYRIYDDIMQLVFFVRAEHMRLLPAAEISPLSPDVPGEEKVILVGLAEQRMAAFEGEKKVFEAPISGGTGRGQNHYASTPTGSLTTFFKRPAGHMTGGDGVGSYYDFPGVPWCTYINDNGVSFHGTYWHNDYGARHSHGCINLPPAQAKWVYRWTMPVVPEGKRHVYQPGHGTNVYITEQPLFEGRELCTQRSSSINTFSKDKCSR